MEQALRIYRRHSKACIHGLTEPIFDGQHLRQDCVCVLNVVGYLRHETGSDGKPRRIRHHSLDTSDWDEARRKRDDFLAWGQLQPPGTGIDALKRDRVTVADAVKFFFESNS